MPLKYVSIFEIAHNINCGGGSVGGNDEKVKLSAFSTISKYLNQHVDDLTIVADLVNEKLVVKTLDGLNTTVAELNFIKGLDNDIMTYINECKKFKGVVQTDADMLALPDPKPGDIVIVETSASHDNQIVTFIYIDSTKGYIPLGGTSISSSSGVVGESWKTNVTAGNLVAGTQINSTDTITSILKKMTLAHEKPYVTCAINPNTLLYRIGTVVPTIDITSKVTKKSSDIKTIDLYINGTSVKSVTGADALNGGTFMHSLTNVSADVTIQCKAVDDKNQTGSNSPITVKFVHPVLTGFASDLSNMTEVIVDKSSTYKWTGVTCSYDKPVIKFPSTFGPVKKVTDANNTWDLTGTFIKTQETIDGMTYNVYTAANAAGLDGYTYVFSF